jgi:hypothetical protein
MNLYNITEKQFREFFLKLGLTSEQTEEALGRYRTLLEVYIETGEFKSGDPLESTLLQFKHLIKSTEEIKAKRKSGDSWEDIAKDSDSRGFILVLEEEENVKILSPNDLERFVKDSELREEIYLEYEEESLELFYRERLRQGAKFKDFETIKENPFKWAIESEFLLTESSWVAPSLRSVADYLGLPLSNLIKLLYG